MSAMLLMEQRGSCTASEAAAELGISRTAAMRILTTLHAKKYAVRDLTQRFSLGPAVLGLAKRTTPELAAAGAPHIHDLTYRLGETVVLAVAEHDEAVIVAQSLGMASTLRVEYEIGYRQPLSKGASGLAILAHLPDDDLRVRDAELSPSILAEIRNTGIARSEGEIRSGMVGIAAPVHLPPDGIAGSLAIVVPASRADDLETHTDLLRSTADLIRNAYRSLLETSRRAEQQAR